MIGRTHHLGDDCLFECYLAELEGSRVAPPTAEHLAACSACGVRFRELVAFMDELRADADQDTSAIFTPERLRTQQQQIMHRLEYLGRAARVITFPGQVIGRRMARTAAQIGPRWAVAAAAAGLLVGVGVGALLDPTRNAVPAVTFAPTSIAVPASLSEATPVSDDETFLSDLETALSGPRNQELLPFDELTPRVSVVSSQLP